MTKPLWTLETALPVVTRIAAIAKNHGFAVALYGSVLNEGHGQNLDLCLIAQQPQTTSVNAQACIDEIAGIIEVERCARGPDLALIHFRDRRRIDMQFFARAIAQIQTDRQFRLGKIPSPLHRCRANLLHCWSPLSTRPALAAYQ
jgi:hypothetical protein